MLNRGLRTGSPLDFKKPAPDTTTLPAPPTQNPKHTQDETPPPSAHKKPKSPKSDPSSASSTASRRFDLKLSVDRAVLAEFENQLAALPPTLRKHVKSTLAKSFAKTISPNWQYSTDKKGHDAVYRVVLTLPDTLIAKIWQKHRSHPLEPETMVLSKYFAPKFNDFLKQYNTPPS